jgi:HEAT repeat protein
MSLTGTLQLIGAPQQQLSRRELKAFSGLDSAQYDEFWSAWRGIPPERRSQIALTMVELAEDNVELDFDQAWLWLLDDDVPSVRVSAIEGLWENTRPLALRRMLELLRTDPDADVRAAAAIALSRFAALAALDELDGNTDDLRRTLLDAVQSRNEPAEVQRRALESAGYFCDDEVQAQIGRAYASDDQLLRESALVAMGRSMLDRWLPAIGRELGSISPALRYEAARAAGEIGEDAQPLLAKLAPLCNDQDSEVALMAIWALGQIGSAAARRTLQQVAKSENEARSQAANEALDELTLGETLI